MKKLIHFIAFLVGWIFGMLIIINTANASQWLDLTKCQEIGNNYEVCKGQAQEKKEKTIIVKKEKTEQEIIANFLAKLIKMVNEYEEEEIQITVTYEEVENESVLIQTDLINDNVNCYKESDGSLTCGSGEGWENL